MNPSPGTQNYNSGTILQENSSCNPPIYNPKDFIFIVTCYNCSSILKILLSVNKPVSQNYPNTAGLQACISKTYINSVTCVKHKLKNDVIAYI